MELTVEGRKNGTTQCHKSRMNSSHPPHHHYQTYRNPKIIIPKWFILLVTTAWLCPSPCTSRPLNPPHPSGVLPDPKLNNTTMVVRIVVSSSSSSDSDFAHLFTSSSSVSSSSVSPGAERRQSTFAETQAQGQQQRIAQRRSSKSHLPNPSFSFTQSNFNRTDHSPWKPFQQQQLHRFESPNFQILSSQSKSSQVKINSPPSSTTTTTITPIPTTYRPKMHHLRASPLLYFLASTTTTTTTTIKPLPFREDIFSVFYRAFSQQSQDSSSSSFLAFKTPVSSHPPSLSSEERQGTFQIFQNSPRKIPSIPNPFQATHSIKGQQQQQVEDSKVVTSVVTRSSSVNVNYPRIRPSSFMILSMGGQNSSSSIPKNTTKVGVTKVTTSQTLQNAGSNKEDDPQEPLVDWSSREFSILKNSNKTQIFRSHPGTTTPNPDSESEGQAGEQRNTNEGEKLPKVEALIQFKEGQDELPPPLNIESKFEKTPNRQTIKSEVNKYWQPEQNWSEPAKVWGEPAKIWGQSEQNWGVQPEKKVEEENTTQSSLWGRTKGEDKEEEDDTGGDKGGEEGQTGTFYELGEDEDDVPSDTIPSELAIPQQPQGLRVTTHHDPDSSRTRKKEGSWELPELTPQLDHSFVDSSSRSVEVAESIQVSLKREMDFQMKSRNPNDSGRVRGQMETTHNFGGGIRGSLSRPSPNSRGGGSSMTSSVKVGPPPKSGTKFGYVLDGSDVRKYRVEERTPDGFIVGEYASYNDNGFLRGVRYTADGTINPRLIHEALMKFLSL